MIDKAQQAILVFDSGLGGLSVVRAMDAMLPDAPMIYVADTAAFPYGNRKPDALASHAVAVIESLSQREDVALVVVACNTLSTLALPAIRAAIRQKVVGTVPAIKVAAERSHSRRFTLLATPNTQDSSYSTHLIDQFAADCRVDRVGAVHLAALAERYLLTGHLDEALLAADMAACYHNDAYGATDMIVLGCTHYPFLVEAMQHCAPWPVSYIDPAPAIAQQVKRVWLAMQHIETTLKPATHSTGRAVRHAYVTREEDVARYQPCMQRFGFSTVCALSGAASG